MRFILERCSVGDGGMRMEKGVGMMCVRRTLDDSSGREAHSRCGLIAVLSRMMITDDMCRARQVER